jgi:hypothetical protein
MINVGSGKLQIISFSEKERVKSIYLNTLNDSIFFVSIRKYDHYSRMKCRTLPLDVLMTEENFKKKS